MRSRFGVCGRGLLGAAAAGVLAIAASGAMAAELIDVTIDFAKVLKLDRPAATIVIGNPGIAEHATLVDIDPADHRAVIDFCLKHSIHLVVIGPEAPLVDGLADNLRTMGFHVFGPNRVPAQLEGSK